MHLLGVLLITVYALLNASSAIASTPSDEKKDSSLPKHVTPTHTPAAHPHHNKKPGPQASPNTKSPPLAPLAAPPQAASPSSKIESKSAFASSETTPLNWPSSHDKDALILQMSEAFARGDRSKLTSLLPQVLTHPLAPWAAYWELKARLEDASIEEIRAFLQTYANTYQEDRLRADWLDLLGSRRDWTTYAQEYPSYRMKDDPELECYGLMIAHLELMQQSSPTAQSLENQIKAAWKRQRDADEGCTWAIDRLLDAKKITPLEVWQKVRYAAQNNHFRLARDLTQSLDTSAVPLLKAAWSQPTRFLKDHLAAPQKINQELLVLALLRLATQDAMQTKELLLSKWGPYLSSEERHWIWGFVGMQLAYNHDPDTLSYFERASNPKDLSDEMLGWYVRTLLRTEQINWLQVEKLIELMSNEQKKDPTWVYWLAKAQLALAPKDAKAREKPLALLRSIAGPKGFYELLAMDELGLGVTLPNPPSAPSAETLARIHNHPGLNRALYAIKLGLRSPGVREWNYSTSLVNAQGQSGRMNDEELLAAAQWAAQEGFWDRSIFTSEKALGYSDPNLLYPMPFKDSVLKASEKYGVPASFVYGLIRQESRFVMDIHSSVGASGLMQVMPKTAKWTAKKIGINPFSVEMLHDKDINTAIGTGYMHLVLESFDGSKALAAAAYNAGPSRSRRWREGPDVEGAIWVENIPFNETRDYVKKVLTNTTLYDSLLTNQPQFIHNHLGLIGPHYPPSTGSADAQNPDLP